MSWDIILFNLSKKVQSLEAINEALLLNTDFAKIFEQHFKKIEKDDRHRTIIGDDFSIAYFVNEEPVSNIMLSIYNENGLFEVIHLAKKNNWQIFDTGLGALLDMDNPTNNGYINFQNYLDQLLEERTAQYKNIHTVIHL
jgi:hypothetical protein